MKILQKRVLVALCGVSSGAFGMDAQHQAAIQPQAVILSSGKVEGYKAVSAAGALGALGIGGLVGTGVVIKKIVRMKKELIVLKKQIQVYPKDLWLRHKRHALLRQVAGMQAGVFFLTAASVILLGAGVVGTQCIIDQWMEDKSIDNRGDV